MAAVLLAAGAPGKRYALPNSRIMIHQGSGGFRGNAPDAIIQMKEWEFLVKRNTEILAQHTGQPLEKVTQDTEPGPVHVVPRRPRTMASSTRSTHLPGDSLIAQAHDAGLSGGEGSSVAGPADAATGCRAKATQTGRAAGDRRVPVTTTGVQGDQGSRTAARSAARARSRSASSSRARASTSATSASTSARRSSRRRCSRRRSSAAG